MNWRHCNRCGFTLAEAMLAVVILAAAACGVLLPFSDSASVHAEGSRRTAAAKLAADLLEEITISLENASEADYANTMNAWDNFVEPEGKVTKIWRTGIYSEDAYKYFSRRATCRQASIGTENSLTILGAWVTVSVCYKGEEIATLKTLVNTNKEIPQ